jgi:hypothetical protein
MSKNPNIVLACEGNEFVFKPNISVAKAEEITRAIVNYAELNRVDLKDMVEFTFNGILTCPVKLTRAAGQIFVSLPDIYNNFGAM